VERDRRAEVVVMNGFSAHADRRELVEFAVACRERGSLSRIAMVHGEPKSQAGLRAALAEQGFTDAISPAPGARITI
jgi:metallo-beta-lactamase family protein